MIMYIILIIKSFITVAILAQERLAVSDPCGRYYTNLQIKHSGATDATDAPDATTGATNASEYETNE